MKSLQVLGLIFLAAATVHSQPTNGPVYWSPVSSPPDCSSLMDNESAVGILNGSGTTIGYSCYVSGTFVWLAAGGPWGSSIRVAAPTSAPIGVDYTFFDTNGNNLSLDTTCSGGVVCYSGGSNDVNFALSANQPAEIDLLGAAGTSHGATETGSVYTVFFCPDAITCGNVLPQLLYSALPTIPWSLSVPIAWDDALSTTWSAEGIDDGGSHRVSFVVYNEDTTTTASTSFNVYVYDSAGNLAGTGTTPPIPPIPVLSDGSYGEAGTYGNVLSQVIKTPLPSGVFKILVDGGPNGIYSAVEVLQFTGSSATTLQVAYDSPPTASASAIAASRRPTGRRARALSPPKRVPGTLIR
ncbi:MAG: hypothetical protein ABSF98_24610 [Bryobacteraceae bacterium]|jgi:hypothetical protein